MKKQSIILGFALIFICACTPEKSESAALPEEKQFQTTAPSHLFFKNMRVFYYEQSTQPGTRIDLYLLRQFDRSDRRPLLYPVIVDNWMDDKAYLQLRPNGYPAGFPDTLRVFWKNGPDSGRYELSLPDWPSQEKLAAQLLESIRRKDSLFIQTRLEGRRPIYEEDSDRRNFLTTLRDFYRLTERE